MLLLVWIVCMYTLMQWNLAAQFSTISKWSINLKFCTVSKGQKISAHVILCYFSLSTSNKQI